MDPVTGIPRAATEPINRAARDGGGWSLKREPGPGLAGAAHSRHLLVPAAEASPERVQALREELAIMSRLLAKAADPERTKPDPFHFYLGGLGQGPDLDALDLDGYGAVFLLDVGYPLVAPPKAAEKPPEAKPDKDAAWEKARRELAGEDQPEEIDALTGQLAGDDGPAFDADKVAALRKRLTESFRHAANLKSLKGEDQVVIVVTGRSTSRTVRLGGQQVVAHNIVGYVSAGQGMTITPSERNADVRHQLTLRAKKAEVDAFAAGQLKADEFAKKVIISTREEAIPSGRPAAWPVKQRSF